MRPIAAVLRPCPCSTRGVSACLHPSSCLCLHSGCPLVFLQARQYFPEVFPAPRSVCCICNSHLLARSADGLARIVHAAGGSNTCA